jgi:hypothetical protein
MPAPGQQRREMPLDGNHHTTGLSGNRTRIERLAAPQRMLALLSN